MKGGADLYEDTTKELLAHYLKSNMPDGEILFLAADPDCRIKGIGTALLNALEERKRGKRFIFTRMMPAHISFMSIEDLKERKRKKSS